ncbi:hypothetical protein XENOCAPTIV_026490 [Xenoophorus captivus]|uniref:RING-type domain-containing protein n=1 Tax=Xenoophorus captivus TaxID=1517983 RepID=A0ABV0RVD3_9TELE
MRWGSERQWRFWRSSCFILDRIWSRRSSRCLWCGSVVCSVRVMLLNAIKEMRTGKGASVNAVFTYIRATYGYDLLKNRGHIKKMLAKLINEGIVDRVKEGKEPKQWDECLNEKADQEGDVMDTTTASLQKSPGKCESDTRDVPRMDELPEERGIASRTDSQNETETPTRASVVPFNTLDYRFECICGELGIIDYKARVQCMNCQLWQHADCVNYKEESLTTTPFYCPHCLVAMKPVSTGATLIISPSSICHQWVEEINHHIRSSSLRVLGVKRHGFIQPHMLAEQDVVITTYDVLLSELNYVDIPHSNSRGGRRFRNQKRYMAVPSPLVAVEWWRICLDEAQMVECPTAKVNKHPVPLLCEFLFCVFSVIPNYINLFAFCFCYQAAEMALRLASVNRWCVSGTPVQRGLEEPLYNVIAQILWRSAKKDVIDQIPPQTEEVHWLHFSPVEGHFYHRQHEVCSQDALVKLRKISDWSLKLGSLDRRTVNTILYPLLRLRQACCHPQAVRGELSRVNLEGEFVEAAEMYREVLRSSEEHKDRLKTDSLQVYRLIFVHAEQLRQHYMTKYDSEVADAHQALQPVLQNIKELKRKEQHIKNHVGFPAGSVILEGPASKEVIEEATICHLRPMRLPLNKVKGQTAIFEEMIEDEEGLMDDRLPTTSRGLWAASETERTLKAILSFAKVKRMDPDLVEEGNTFMELFENWKKEYKVEQNRVKLLNDQADKSTGGLNPEPCPICARPLGQEWAVLTCGHCFCNECIAIIVEQYSVGSRRRAIKCAICRQTTSHTEISYVFTTQSYNHEQDIPVKGSHSTKVEAVVRTLKKIQRNDPIAKCLVFSTVNEAFLL